ncbi:MAG: sulfite exporter TauE/SafE family protein [Lutispora sp.]|jgi:uncharacterized membrane protein YfcA|uniref:sulfite exporter TauE/SafE family protein n=1 Tax=Lutispora sp. TaxID=2828727 RepID=UPI003565149D
MKPQNKISLWIIGFLAGIFNGLCGSGGGTILVPSLVFLTNVIDHHAHATAIAVILPLTIISSLIYAKSGIININITIKVTIGTIIGAYIGSKMLNKLPINILRKLFGIFMIIAAIRMVI